MFAAEDSSLEYASRSNIDEENRDDLLLLHLPVCNYQEMGYPGLNRIKESRISKSWLQRLIEWLTREGRLNQQALRDTASDRQLGLTSWTPTTDADMRSQSEYHIV